MPKVCSRCGRPNVKNVGAGRRAVHICDLVTLSDGRSVHADRVEIGGDLHDDLGRPDEKGYTLKVVSRNWTPEMRAQKRKGRL